MPTCWKLTGEYPVEPAESGRTERLTISQCRTRKEAEDMRKRWEAVPTLTARNLRVEEAGDG